LFRRVSLVGVCGAVFVAGGCSLLFPAPWRSEGEGEAGDEGDGDGEEEPVFRLVDVDGDGSARPLAAATPGDVQGRAAAHRVAGRLRVTFTGATTATAARFSGDDGDIAAELENAEEGVAYVTVPASVPVGRMVLLTLVAGAASAQAEVFFLQGEPGPPGPPGPKTLVARGDDCPLGGSHTLFGVDDNGNDVLDPAEVDVDHADCDSVIGTARTIAIADEDSLRAVLTQLGEVRIAPAGSVTLQLPPGEIAMTGEVVFDHVDGERILLVGADPTATDRTTVVFPDDGNGLVVTGGLRLKSLALTSPTATSVPVLSGIGVDVRDGGFLVVESDGNVVVSGFGIGVRADAGGVVVVDLVRDDNDNPVRVLQAVGNSGGFLAGPGGLLDIPGALAQDNDAFGFIATGGSITAHDSASENAGDAGYLSQFGGYVAADRATSTVRGDGSAAFFSANGGSMSCFGATGSILGTVTTARAMLVMNGASAVCVAATMNGKILVASGSTAVMNDTGGVGLSVQSDQNSTMVHACTANALAGCRVTCVLLDGTGRCIGP
jgi:hypothetical protein